MEPLALQLMESSSEKSKKNGKKVKNQSKVNLPVELCCIESNGKDKAIKCPC